MSDAPTKMLGRAPQSSDSGETVSIKFTWERAFRDNGQPPALMAVGLLISTFASSKNGEAWPSVATLAKALRSKPRMVQGHLATLEAEGWITRKLGGGTRTTTYGLALPEVAPTPAPLKTRHKKVSNESPSKQPPVKDDTGAKVSTGVADDTGGVSSVTPTPVKDDTQSINEQSINQSPLHEPAASRPPGGVSTDKWNVVRPILNEVVRVLDLDGTEFLGDWEELTGKAALCHGIYTMLLNGNSPRTVVELLVEGGYDGVAHPARALYVRVKEYQNRRPSTTSAYVNTSVEPTLSGKKLIDDAMVLLAEKMPTKATIYNHSGPAQSSGGRNVR